MFLSDTKGRREKRRVMPRPIPTPTSTPFGANEKTEFTGRKSLSAMGSIDCNATPRTAPKQEPASAIGPPCAGLRCRPPDAGAEAGARFFGRFDRRPHLNPA